jgi:zinc protease
VPTLPQSKTVTIKDRVAATMILRTWAVPGLNDPDAVPLDVFGQVLGGLASSRLDNALVRKEKIAVQVSAGVQSMSQLGIFQVQAIVKPGVDPALVAKRLDEIVADLIENGPTADEVQRVATTCVSGRIYGPGIGRRLRRQGRRACLRASSIRTIPPSSRSSSKRWPGSPRRRCRPLRQMADAPVADDHGRARPARSLSGSGDGAPRPSRSRAHPRPSRSRAPAARCRRRPDRRSRLPRSRTTKLSNGIEIVYANRTAVPITQVVISFDAGVAADPAAKLGTQSLMLSLLDEGTTSKDSTAIAEARERLGADIGTGSSSDRTYLSLARRAPIWRRARSVRRCGAQPRLRARTRSSASVPPSSPASRRNSPAPRASPIAHCHRCSMARPAPM